MGISKRKSFKKSISSVDVNDNNNTNDNINNNTSITNTTNDNVNNNENIKPLADSETKNIDNHPIEIGNNLVVEYRDGSKRLAKIIEKNNNNNVYQYYVHYVDFNRRMDEWITIDRIVEYPSKANILEKKRKINELKKNQSTTSIKPNVDVSSLDQPKPEKNKRGFAPGHKANCKKHRLLVTQQATLGLHNTTLQLSKSGQSLSSVKSDVSNAKSHDSIDDDIGMDIDGDKDDNDVDVDDEKLDDQLKALISGLGNNGPTTVAELEHDEHEGMDEAILHEHEEITKVKNVSKVLFGKHILECWYYSPFPKEYHPNGPVDMLYFCEFTFRFFRTKAELIRYQQKPNLPRHPPGNEIYRDSNVSMFEVDGAVEKYYCQNLCYFAKLFLDHKTLYFDVDPFFFYVLCTQDERGFHPVGFYSKEKYSDAGYNLACILTFPSSQRKGYGRFLISFSYELSKKEEKIGSPEKPLSDLGAVSYRSYWASTLLRVLRYYPQQSLSIMELTKMTSIVTEDVVQTLNFLGLLQINKEGKYTIYAPPALIEELLVKYPVGNLPVDPDHLHWAPLVVTDPKKDKWSIKFYM